MPKSSSKSSKEKKRKKKKKDDGALAPQASALQTELAEPIPIQLVPLPIVSIPLIEPTINKEHDVVPPQSLKSDLMFEDAYHMIPKTFPSLDEFEIPYVREEGIKACIEKLGGFFDCQDYNFSLIQFWFLDILTDCMWRCQDEYKFPIELQRIVLEWILCVFNIIRFGHDLGCHGNKVIFVRIFDLMVAEIKRTISANFL